MSLAKQIKEREWELIIATLKENGVISMLDDEFDCPNCGETIDYEEYMDGDEPYGCPFCGDSLD